MENNSAENQIETTNAVVTPPPPCVSKFHHGNDIGNKIAVGGAH